MSLFLKVAPNKRQNAKNANLIVLAKNAHVNERVHERGLEMPRHSEPESGVHCSGPVEGTVRVSHVTVSSPFKNYVFFTSCSHKPRNYYYSPAYSTQITKTG